MAKDSLDTMRESHLEISMCDRIFDLPTPEHRLGLYHPATYEQEVTRTYPEELGFAYA